MGEFKAGFFTDLNAWREAVENGSFGGADQALRTLWKNRIFRGQGRASIPGGFFHPLYAQRKSFLHVERGFQFEDTLSSWFEWSLIVVLLPVFRGRFQVSVIWKVDGASPTISATFFQ